MCSLDTVIHPCPVLGDWVRIDQTRADCAGEHLCESAGRCPLHAYFTDAAEPAARERCRGDLRDWCVV